jgi:hypothetical protein
MSDHTSNEERRSRRLPASEWIGVGVGSGLLGGIALAVPIILWDWARSGHHAFELPMAVTAWIFGLQHFSHVTYLAWPVVIGVAVLAAYSALSGLVFTGIANRFGGIACPLASLGAGFAWAFVSFIFFWDMLLPLARDGEPLRATPGGGQLFVAPNWVWILGFTLFGVVTGACYGLLRTSPARAEPEPERRLTRTPLHRAA